MNDSRGRRRPSSWLQWGLVAVAVIVPACVSAAAAVESPRGPLAPAIRSARWLNSKPLATADLRGKVVLVEFWTFDCINCLRSVPAMKKLHAAHPGGDVVIVGVHTPELEEERDPAHVAQAVARLQIDYPVALDNDYRIWRSYRNRYWPALYLVDKRGLIRHTHIGELHVGTPAWDEVVRWIEELRKEPA